MHPQVTDYEKRTLFPLLFFTGFVYNFVTKEWSNIIDQADYNLTTDSIGRDNFIHPYVTYQMFKLRFYYFIKKILAHFIIWILWCISVYGSCNLHFWKGTINAEMYL